MVDCKDEIPAVAKKPTAAAQIASETENERIARLKREYPIDWYFKRYGSWDICEGHDGGYSMQDGEQYCHYFRAGEKYLDDELKSLIIYGSNGMDDGFGNDIRFSVISEHYVKDILSNPYKYSTVAKNFVYHPDVLIGIIIAKGYTQSKLVQASYEDWYNVYNNKN